MNGWSKKARPLSGADGTQYEGRGSMLNQLKGTKKVEIVDICKEKQKDGVSKWCWLK